MKRRAFIQRAGITTGALLSLPYIGFAKDKGWQRNLVSKIDAPDIPFPPKKRIPLGWKGFPVGVDQSVTTITFTDKVKAGDELWLRITAAIDFRERKQVEATLARSGTKLGVFDMQFAHPFQPFQIPVDKKLYKKILEKS